MVVVFVVGGVGGAEEGSEEVVSLVTGTASRKQAIANTHQTSPAGVEELTPVAPPSTNSGGSIVVPGDLGAPPSTTTTTPGATTTTPVGDQEAPSRPSEAEPTSTSLTTDRAPPAVGLCAGEGANSVVFGSAFGSAAYCCGPNSAKQLGVGKLAPVSSRWVPIPVSKPVLCVSAGSHHSLLCTTDGQVFSCGRGDGGQLGLGEKTKNATSFAAVALPAQTEGDIVQPKAKQVAVASSARRFENQSASYVLDDEGRIYAFGNNNHMKLGLGDVDPPRNAWTPRRVAKAVTTPITATDEEPKFAMMSAGKHHVLACDAMTGRVFAWGAGDMGRLGLSDKKPRGAPTLVSALRDLDPTAHFDAVVARETYSLAFASESNAAYSWGFGTRGQLGRGAAGTRCEPAEPGKIDWGCEYNVLKLVANDDAVIAVRKDKVEHLCWGKLDLGDLKVSSLEPKLLVQLDSSASVLAFDLCGTHALIATESDLPKPQPKEEETNAKEPPEQQQQQTAGPAPAAAEEKPAADVEMTDAAGSSVDDAPPAKKLKMPGDAGLTDGDETMTAVASEEVPPAAAPVDATEATTTTTTAEASSAGQQQKAASSALEEEEPAAASASAADAVKDAQLG